MLLSVFNVPDIFVATTARWTIASLHLSSLALGVLCCPGGNREEMMVMLRRQSRG